MLLQENFKFKSSEIAVDASKTANSDRLLKFVISTSALRPKLKGIDFEAKPNTRNGIVRLLNLVCVVSDDLGNQRKKNYFTLQKRNPPFQPHPLHCENLLSLIIG